MINERHNAKHKIAIGIASIAIVTLSACGGGGEESTSNSISTPVVTTTAEGAYTGSGRLTGGTISVVSSTTLDTDFSLLVLENGEFWMPYGKKVDGVFNLSSIIKGVGKSLNGRFTSSTAKDYGSTTPIESTVVADYNTSTKSISGTLSTKYTLVSFSGAQPQVNSPYSYNYNTPVNLSSILGAWKLDSTSGNTISLNVLANGSFTGLDQASCSLSGKFTPRSSGKNVFDVAIKFGPAPCGLANQTGTGIATSHLVASGINQLFMATVDSSNSYGSAAVGTR